MHSANFRVNVEDLKNYLGRIRDLGEALEHHDPEFKGLAKDIDEVSVCVCHCVCLPLHSYSQSIH